MYKFINGIQPNPVKGDFDEAMDKLLENIHLDFVKWSNGRTRNTVYKYKSGS